MVGDSLLLRPSLDRRAKDRKIAPGRGAINPGGNGHGCPLRRHVPSLFDLAIRGGRPPGGTPSAGAPPPLRAGRAAFPPRASPRPRIGLAPDEIARGTSEIRRPSVR